MDHVSPALIIIMLTMQCVYKSSNINVYLSFVIIKTLSNDLIL